MFIVPLEYIKDLVVVKTYLAEHIAYLERYYQANMSVVSGRKQSRTDGVILIKASGRRQAEKLIAEDPFHRGGMAKYTITELIPTKITGGLENCLKTI